MEIRKSVVVRRIDDDGVGIGHVDSVLHNGGRKEYVVFMIHEVEYDFLQFLRLHPSMPHAHPGIRHIAFNHGLEFRQVVDSVVDKEYLSVSAEFEIDSLRHDFR